MKMRSGLLFSFMLLMVLSFSLPAPTVAGSVSSSEIVENLDLTGDFRIRYDHRQRDLPEEDAIDRLRQRFRLGMAWNNSTENWSVAAGLVTGPDTATSANDDYSENKIFETGNISLDYAYAVHTLDNFKIIAGQQKNPFETSWLLWDSDVRPAGFTGQFGLDPFFVTAGWYVARYIDNDIAQLEAIQAGAKFKTAIAALSFYNLHRTDEILDDAAVVVPSGYDYQVIDALVSGNFKTDMFSLVPYAQAFYNLGAEGDEGQGVLGGTIDPEDENLGWVVGIDAILDEFSLSVAYAEVGADSWVQDLKEGDFGDGINSTDVKGWRIGLGYKITKNFGIAATSYQYEAKERDLDQNPEIYLVDLNYKF